MQVYTKESGKTEFRHFLDNQQYQTNGILRYERIFGQGYVSTGGFETTKVCFSAVPAVCGVDVAGLGVHTTGMLCVLGLLLCLLRMHSRHRPKAQRYPVRSSC